MAHSFNKIWIHAIFATKDRAHLISRNVETLVYNHLKEQLIDLDCPVRIINGMEDHLHLLFLLNPKKTIADVLKQLKGNTSHWMNEQDVIHAKFSWQTGYAAFSVSESQLDKVHQYILNQKEHYKKKTFAEEYEEFMKLHGFVGEDR